MPSSNHARARGAAAPDAAAYGLNSQNCNQWVVEPMAAAWCALASPPPSGLTPGPGPALRLRVSLPATLEAFAQARWPASQRLELCLDTDRIVAHDGPQALAEPCQAGPGDRESRLD